MKDIIKEMKTPTGKIVKLLIFFMIITLIHIYLSDTRGYAIFL